MASDSIRVSVRMSPDFERIVKTLPQVKGAVTKRANEIASDANAMSAWFKTGYYHRDHQSPAVGGTTPVYSYDRAEESNKYGCVAIVHPVNYAAMKDTHENNTLLKAKG